MKFFLSMNFLISVMPVYDCTLWQILKASDKRKSSLLGGMLSKSPTNIPVKLRIKIIDLILDGLIYIQSQGVCHLDIKPSNIMMNKNGSAWDEHTLVIADFGISAPVDGLTGRRCGTPGFGSPEQFIGTPSRMSDNYSFGKLIILVLFQWNRGWNMLAQPLSPGQDPATKQLPHIRAIISTLLSVSY